MTIVPIVPGGLFFTMTAAVCLPIERTFRAVKEPGVTALTSHCAVPQKTLIHHDRLSS
ncbi:hypothetical protein [Bacillus benzoevorans]|uniref:Uncharacterized protein n=1 Tax=Bacillus benzoevorans TaxID=1456 RepID=A0A7X0LVH5_9BACI|nr:hypothetical protein [Bacillus benzoevorans]